MHRGYGGPGSGAAGGSNQPTRPMATQPEPPVKLTPITGRVSRAKKGVPVHVCEICKPPKVCIGGRLLGWAVYTDSTRPSHEPNTSGGFI